MSKASSILVVVAGALSGAVFAGPAAADAVRQARGTDSTSAFMRVYGTTLPPYGFVRFCERHPKECRAATFDDTRLLLTPERQRELSEVNREINKRIEAATDLEIYGEIERWTLPTTRGDCEDYALLKRHVLMQRGWPASALLMTVVIDEKGEGHAVLTARTAQGDYVLDNKFDDIRPWSKVRYDFVMRQSYIDPRVWVSLDPRSQKSPALFAGVRNNR